MDAGVSGGSISISCENDNLKKKNVSANIPLPIQEKYFNNMKRKTKLLFPVIIMLLLSVSLNVSYSSSERIFKGRIIRVCP